MSKWEWKKLKDICEKGSSNIKQSDLKDLTGDYPIFGASGYIQNVDFYQRNRDYIGIIKDGSGVGRTMLLPAFSSVIGTLQYILPKEGNDIKFINYALQNIDFSKSIQGAAIPHIYFKDYGETEILVPPLSEQKSIVKFLDEEFSKIETLKTNAETNLKNAKELFESTLEKELNPGKNGTLPSGWEWKTLRELCILRPSKNEALSHLKGTDEVSFLPMEDLNIRERNTIPHKSRALSEVHGSYTFFAEGDVLLAKVTPCFENGKMGIASNLLNGVGFGSSEYIVFRTTKSMINSYLFYVLMSSRFISGGKKQMLGACGLKRLSKEYVESFQIPLPPLSVQKEIVARLDKLSENVKRLEVNYKQIIANCDELKKSILKKTFEGES
ncbi:putative type I restriction-modification system, S subunit [Fibrobacter succinogenes subsp. succinogenes S85]|uniref:Putative type I restriction-modification system, S subunit n=1 Tax=Fibrobacter succinogenes (strain ATCC 19169 / S85) TaxID=59374 RepID=C9RRX8_FIBSS|nr:restriction endonuclease subunit S [Fibrobacter succinogenes]ACX75314.1 restriction modification system DNA specificity domain protein [Fibrobacter succinogenes subsp. succinogenes S85]ADL26374.1 putative type I restriction-modification system, S subunit [Fibrobacter succinogenes subsp. succinogenes S85]